MGYNDRATNNGVKTEKFCPFCGKRYSLTVYNQIPGFRDVEEQICPYCGKVIKTSMEYEYVTEKLEK